MRSNVWGSLHSEIDDVFDNTADTVTEFKRILYEQFLDKIVHIIFLTSKCFSKNLKKKLSAVHSLW